MAKDYAVDEATIANYNLQLTLNNYVADKTEEACSTRQSKYTTETAAAGVEAEAAKEKSDALPNSVYDF